MAIHSIEVFRYLSRGENIVPSKIVKSHGFSVPTIIYLLACAGFANGSPTQDSRSLGPSSVGSELEKVERIREAARWPTLPSLEQYNLKLAADYQMLYQVLSSSPSEDTGFGGVARFYGTWQATETGHLVFKAEHRHELGGYISPKALHPQAGIAGVSGPTFSDAEAVLTNLYWGQQLFGNKVSYVAGIVDPSDYVDAYGLANVWTDFNNLAFSTNPTIPVPAQGLGAAGRWASSKNLYVLGGIADANADPHKPDDAFDRFFSTSEYFSHIEIGRAGSWEDRWAQNAHVTLWHVDQREELGIASDWGVSFSWNHRYGKWLPFARGGFADRGVGLQEKMVSVGAGYAPAEGDDYIGLGISWGESASSDRDQYIVENYYRWQTFHRLQIVPSIQWIINPANNPGKNYIWQGAVRIRATF